MNGLWIVILLQHQATVWGPIGPTTSQFCTQLLLSLLFALSVNVHVLLLVILHLKQSFELADLPGNVGKTWENRQWNGPGQKMLRSSLGMATTLGLARQFLENPWGSSMFESFPVLQLVPILSLMWQYCRPWGYSLCRLSLLRCAGACGCQGATSLLLHAAVLFLWFLWLFPFYVPQDAPVRSSREWANEGKGEGC